MATSTGGFLRGTLDDFPIDAVLSMLAASKRTGVLHWEGPTSGDLHLRDGKVLLGDGSTDDLVESLFWLSLVANGEFAFTPGDAREGEAVEVTPVLERVQARVGEWREISRSVPSLDAVLSLRPASSAVELTPEQWDVVRYLDGTRTVRDVVVATGGAAMDVCRDLHVLVTQGLAGSEPDGEHAG